MKLAILNITAGGMSGGYKKYLENLLPRISSNESIDKIICALPSGVTIDVMPDRHPKIDFIRVAPIKITNKNAFHRLKKILNNFHPDVVYVPVERMFPYERAPVVTMVQNMEPFVCPFTGNPPLEVIKNLLRVYNAQKALNRSDRIIAISTFVKQHLIDRLCIDPGKVGLVYHGIDSPGRSTDKPRFIPSECDRFLFTAGSIRPARGLEDVFGALKYLAKQSYRVPLVVAGSSDSTMARYKRKLQAWLDRNDLSANVIWAGSISEKEMNWCYQNCSAFVMTSRVESFGLIALEAMSNGSLCISAANPCLPEIFGDAAVYYHSGDGKALSETIMCVLSWGQSKKLRASRCATERASQFSWDACTERTVDELRTAMNAFRDSRKVKQ